LLVASRARTLLAEQFCEAFVLARYPSMGTTARTWPPFWADALHLYVTAIDHDE
jgi:hypothetical protein